MSEKIAVTLKRSMYGRRKGHIECVHGLGLRRIRHTRLVDPTPENLGMIRKVSYLLSVEEVKS